MGPGSRGPLLPPQQVLPLIASPTSQPPVDNREPLAASCGQFKTLGKSGNFQDSLHTPHCALALSTQPTFQCPGVGACGVCWATASNLGSYDAQRLADTEGFDATARWGCNSHRPGAVSGCCDLLGNAEVGPWPTTFPAACPSLDQVTLTSGDWNGKPRGLWHDHCPTLVRDMEERPSPPLSSDLSVARVKTCRSLARHGRRQDTAADLSGARRRCLGRVRSPRVLLLLGPLPGRLLTICPWRRAQAESVVNPFGDAPVRLS